MTAKTATKTHRVFDAIQGLWPVTFANVREADPQGLLDIFEGSDSTRDRYFERVVDWKDWLNLSRFTDRGVAGNLWATYLSGFDTEHRDECCFSDGSQNCICKQQQYTDNQQWGTELFEAIQQRIQELNG